MTNEWVEWHRSYEGDHPHARRLEVVRDCIREALSQRPPGPIRIISMCAGDGRDLLRVLPGHPRSGDVEARLVDQAPELIESGRAEVARAGLHHVEFVLGDAAATRVYAGAVPADIVLACGVFGNISDGDVRRTIDHLPGLCAKDATVIWTRGRFEPDLTPSIREWFRAAGFAELSFTAIPGTTASVGVHRLAIPARPYRPDEHLFTFLSKEERPSSRAMRQEC